MPPLEFKGKQFIYSHHLSVPFRELKVDTEKSLPVPDRMPSLDDNLIIHGYNLETLNALRLMSGVAEGRPGYRSQ
jgi:adenine-specific DNA-methyltransferase